MSKTTRRNAERVAAQLSDQALHHIIYALEGIAGIVESNEHDVELFDACVNEQINREDEGDVL